MHYGPPALRTGTKKSLTGGAVLGVVAWGLLAVQIAKVLSTPVEPVSMVVSVAIPSMLSVTLFIGGIGIYAYDLDDLALRISGWTVLGLCLFAVILGGELHYLQPGFSETPLFSVLLVNVAAGGAVLGFVIGLYDARQRLLHEDLREEYSRALGLSQRLSVLARILRHDLRNHLNVIIGQAETLLERSSAPAELDAARSIQQSGAELETISDSIGRFSTILADPRPDQTTRRVDLRETVENAVETVRDRHSVEESAFDVTAPDSAMVRASPLLPQAVTELVENAIVHNDADTPRIAIDIEERDGGERGTVFRLEDNGPGIPDDEVRIHDLDTESQLEHSLGFGLWLVRWVVTASNAELSFDTEDGQGTTVRIHFPD